MLPPCSGKESMNKIRIGTRGSALALAQAKLAAAALEKKGYATELVVVRTRGDENLQKSLSDIGRGAFTDVFSQILSRGEIDVAVHSAKDLPTTEEKDAFFCLPRGDARDVLVFSGEVKRIGTGSPRRAAGALHLFPQAEILPVRGNVDTRLRKLAAGEYDALVLAAAGLSRLGLLQGDRVQFENHAFGCRFFSPQECVPAACQGIIALEGGAGECVNDPAARRAALIERRAQRALDGDCSGGAGAYFDGTFLFVQREGKTARLIFRGEETFSSLSELL